MLYSDLLDADPLIPVISAESNVRCRCERVQVHSPSCNSQLFCSGGDDDPYTMSWRGIDNRTYYMVDTTQYAQLLNYSGCGNTISGNHPVTMQLIIDSCKR